MGSQRERVKATWCDDKGYLPVEADKSIVRSLALPIVAGITNEIEGARSGWGTWTMVLVALAARFNLHRDDGVPEAHAARTIPPPNCTY